MRFFLLAAIAVPFASSPAYTPEAPAPTVKDQNGSSRDAASGCANRTFHYAEGTGKGEVRRLDELPAGNLVLAVVRHVDGCQKPVIVSRGYGFGAPATEPQTSQVLPKARRW